jgi:hypothetical protein
MEVIISNFEKILVFACGACGACVCVCVCVCVRACVRVCCGVGWVEDVVAVVELLFAARLG